MKMLILYLLTAIIFFAVDAVGLRLLIKPAFERHIAHLLADPFRTVPAALFYLGYAAGLLWFVSVPALARRRSVGSFDRRCRLGAHGLWDI